MSEQTWPILRYRDGGFEALQDPVVSEVPLTLYVNDREVITVLTLGEHPLELALGFLSAEGFFSRKEELLDWEVGESAVRVRLAAAPQLVEGLREKRTVTTGCGKGTTFYTALDALRCRPVEAMPRFGSAAVLARMKDLQDRSTLYRATGGTHNASLADEQATRLFRTDIGRHNAVDMLGGRALLDDLDLTSLMLLTTGRISSEILIKAAKMRVPVIVSRSAPTLLALQLAEELRVTVVGYTRGGRFNVYTHPERIEGTGAGPRRTE